MTRKISQLILILLFSTNVLWADDRPNIVWITTEDNSAWWLRLYDAENGVPMPNVEKLADQGIVFNHAFSNGAVCSVARSTLLSGCYAMRAGSQFHRNAFEVPFPEGLKSYPEYFRDAGYYTANCYKEDYNFKTEKIWDESSKKASYRNRKPGQPFFQVWSLHDTHESRMHKPLDERDENTLITKPKDVELYPYHPNTAVFRKSYAHYYDKHRDDDRRIGALIQQLEEDSLMDNTIIFYYGDHGGTLPRSKGYIYESGLQVPLIVYIPEKWKHLFPSKAGSRVDGFVSFVDFAPTVLHLAGIEVPEQMDGEPFLGEGITLDALNKREETFGHADRFDEKYDLVRSYRKGRYKYMRSYQPFNIDGLYNSYRYKQAGYKEWKELYEAKKLNEVQSAFFEKRSPEALYDLEADPHETVNLAADPAYADLLEEMRGKLVDKLSSLHDLSFYPEAYLANVAGKNPVGFGLEHKAEIDELIQIADLQLKPYKKAKSGIKKALKSKDPWVRYWGLITCSTFGDEAAEFIPLAKKLQSEDEEVLVKLRAAEFLALVGEKDPVASFQALLGNNQNSLEILLILNSAALFKTMDASLQFELDEQKLVATAGGHKNQEYWIKSRVDFLNGK
ncbi:sulfatase-like hydrolase/transferase [Flammeovirgaceae bacterium SG7u.111]|nr:sulfatase-like hydrolase/transferase [Flammeovirgaceae bacterium SG7u.132]WPO34192.1 sulfatase-like hydrolase/transferase [Flammeovirgaceae bacterium SG7u.111]